MGKRKGSLGISETLAVPKLKDEEDEEEDIYGKEEKGFFACYLLTSLSPRHKGHTYIGFTVNPRRRIRQHNGEIRNGAWRTKSKRPWEMVLCVYGFPTGVSALQFEWAWQHPRESLAVRQAATNFKSLSGLANKIKLAYTMLSLPAWQSLNATVNYFSTKYRKHSAGCPSMPQHMKVQVRPMDELPCYNEGNNVSFYYEEEWEDAQCHDILTDTINHNHPATQNSTHNATEQFGQTEGNSENCLRQPSTPEDDHGQPFGLSFDIINISSNSNETTTFDRDMSGIIKQKSVGSSIPRGGSQFWNSPTSDVHGEFYDSINCSVRSTLSDVSSNSNKQETAEQDILVRNTQSNVEFIWPRGNRSTATIANEESAEGTTMMNNEHPVDFVCVIADEVRHPYAGNDVSYEGEVIDLLTPSPDCTRISSCRKKRRAIIDLTRSPVFVQL